MVVDNESWILPFAEKVVAELQAAGDHAALIRQHDDVPHGAVAFYLGCVKVTPPTILARNKKNLVVHASDLPKGRGFSPLVWLILDGINKIPVCLIEAAEAVDAGAIVYKEYISFEGHELNDELRAAIGAMHIALCTRYLAEVDPPQGLMQQGEPSYYPRRKPADSRVDPNKTIAEQFDLLRVVDSDRYPAYFEYRGREYELHIKKKGPKA